jgi:acyl-CoA thioesterase-1
MLGDSITKGVRAGVTAEESFSSLVQSELRKRGHAVEVVNVGIGGERTDQAIKRLDRDVIARKPHLVVIMYGTNDSYVDRAATDSRLSAEDYRTHLTGMITRLKQAGARPIVMTEPRWGKAARNGLGENPNVRLARFMDACRDVARREKAPLVDHFAHWTEREVAGVNIAEWTTDQCHPNPAGHKVLADLIVPVIERLLMAKP